MKHTRRTILGLQVANEKPETQDNMMSYQPLKLIKVMDTRIHNNTAFSALQVAEGLEVIAPDTEFREGILQDLVYEEGKPTKCDFLIVVAMYNESAEHFTNTLSGITENLDDFYEAGVDPSNITCVIIVDGIKPFLGTFNKQKEFFAQFFDDEIIKQRFKVSNVLDCKIPNQTESDEFAHCFMQKMSFGNSPHVFNLIMCVKHYNRRKLNSHLWFFGGFCELFQPNYVMLLDVGTKPLKGSLFYLYEAMVCNPSLAGCCGEIKPMDYDIWKIVVPAQVVEYKFSHMLDKALESVIGYITVLPGAFSAYKWEALQGSPLWDDYFKSICHPELMNAFQSNIYLAEDRVLSLALISKKDCNYVLRYVRTSLAETDVPDSLAVLMAQRRRWINGSWFALIDAIKRFQTIYESSHSLVRKCLFTVQMFYYLFNVIYSWFMVSAFCFSFMIAIKHNSASSGGVYTLGDALIAISITILIVIYICSLGVKPKRVEDFFKIISMVLGLFQIYIVYLVVAFIADNSWEKIQLVVFILGGSVAAFTLVTVLNCQAWTILKGAFHFLFMVPTYLNIFTIYSICNMHDCTWGNRPDSLSADERDRLEEFEEFRTRWAIIWALCNTGFIYIMTIIQNNNPDLGIYFIEGIIGAGILVLAIRITGGVIYFFVEVCMKKMKRNVRSVKDLKKKRRNTSNKSNGGASDLQLAKLAEMRNDFLTNMTAISEEEEYKKKKQKAKKNPRVQPRKSSEPDERREDGAPSLAISSAIPRESRESNFSAMSSSSESSDNN